MSLPDDLSQELEAIGENIEGIVEEAAANAGENDVFTMQVANNLVFFGKSLAAWEDELCVAIPEGKLDAEAVRALYVQLANTIQRASHYYCLSNAGSSISSAGLSIKKAELITSLMAHYNANNLKMPPQALIERMADNYIRKLSNMSMLSRIVRDFWKEKLATLDKVRSCLGAIGMTEAVRLKYQDGGDF